jgi:hypothetical protein
MRGISVSFTSGWRRRAEQSRRGVSCAEGTEFISERWEELKNL